LYSPARFEAWRRIYRYEDVLFDTRADTRQQFLTVVSHSMETHTRHHYSDQRIQQLADMSS